MKTLAIPYYKLFNKPVHLLTLDGKYVYVEALWTCGTVDKIVVDDRVDSSCNIRSVAKLLHPEAEYVLKPRVEGGIVLRSLLIKSEKDWYNYNLYGKHE
jgi:hypothetical protein